MAKSDFSDQGGHDRMTPEYDTGNINNTTTAMIYK